MRGVTVRSRALLRVLQWGPRLRGAEPLFVTAATSRGL